jgi:hypothetical protein
MIFKGIYRDGIIILEDATGLRNGTVVEVTRTAERAKAATKPTAKSKKKSSTRRKRSGGSVADWPAFGIWKNRPDWKGKTSVEIARELREKALGHRNRKN